MRTDLVYASEKFRKALSEMATSAKSLQDRLHIAYMSFDTIKASDFPDAEIRSEFEEIMRRLTAVQDDTERHGVVRVTLDQMSDGEAEELAKLIENFYREYLTD